MQIEIVSRQMNVDTEIEAMSAIAKSLEGLEETARKRVLSWAAGRYGLASAATAHSGGRTIEHPEGEHTSYPDFASLFDAASPTTRQDKALVGGYWFQIEQNQADFESQSVNNELKNLGHALIGINKDMDGLIRRKPNLVLQVQKSGKSKQARKRYRLTKPGIDRVNAMLAGDAAGDD
jgi:hypothetical protein